MDNRIKAIFEQRGIKAASFAREWGITPSTLYAILDGTTDFEKIRIGTFIQIAKGLGMTADELYHGCKQNGGIALSDRDEMLVRRYQNMNEAAKSVVDSVVSSMEKDTANRVEKNGQDANGEAAASA